MRPKTGTIYTRDCSISRSQVSSIDKDDGFPINKYQMAATIKSAITSASKTSKLISDQQTHPFCPQTTKKTLKVHFCEANHPTPKCEQIYDDLMSSIRISTNSNVDSLEQLNRDDTFVNHEQHFSCKSDSLQKFQERNYMRNQQPLADLTNMPISVDNPNKTLQQISSLQRIFKELKFLKGFKELEGSIETIEDNFLEIEQNILKAGQNTKSHKVSGATWCTTSGKSRQDY